MHTRIVYVDGSATRTCVWYKNDPEPVVETWWTKRTGNQAEYFAILRAVEIASYRNIPAIVVLSDSQLAVKQLNGEYKVRNAGLMALWKQVTDHISNFSLSVCFIWIPREKNIAGQALEELERKTGGK